MSATSVAAPPSTRRSVRTTSGVVGGSSGAAWSESTTPQDATERLRIDVHVDDPRARREVLRPTDDAVVEAHAHADDQVGVLHGQIGLDGAVHAHHAKRLGVLLGEHTQAEERGPDWDAAG